MRNRLPLFFRLIFVFILSAYLFSSCVPIKRIEYLQQQVEKEDSLKSHFTNLDLIVYKIQPKDNLYITVNSAIARSENFFSSQNVSQSSNYYSNAGIYLNSYAVSDSGYIDFPFVGKIYVKGLTVEQAKDLIVDVVNDYIKEATVIVKLAIFKVTVLGEVNRPGTVDVYRNRVNIFELLSAAGDMTTFAKRDNVILIRETETGSSVHHLNLNDISILESDYYYILPDDVVYVPPVKGKNFAFANFPYALIFSTITTTLLLINFFQTN